MTSTDIEKELQLTKELMGMKVVKNLPQLKKEYTENYDVVSVYEVRNYLENNIIDIIYANGRSVSVVYKGRLFYAEKYLDSITRY